MPRRRRGLDHDRAVTRWWDGALEAELHGPLRERGFVRLPDVIHDDPNRTLATPFERTLAHGVQRIVMYVDPRPGERRDADARVDISLEIHLPRVRALVERMADGEPLLRPAHQTWSTRLAWVRPMDQPGTAYFCEAEGARAAARSVRPRILEHGVGFLDRHQAEDALVRIHESGSAPLEPQDMLYVAATHCLMGRAREARLAVQADDSRHDVDLVAAALEFVDRIGTRH